MTKENQLWQLCQDFVREQRVYSSECVYQSDRVIENAYVLIDRMCELVGYYNTPDED